MTEPSDAWERLVQRARPAYREAPAMPADLADRVRRAAGRVEAPCAAIAGPWGPCALVAALLAIAAMTGYALTGDRVWSDPGAVIAAEELP